MIHLRIWHRLACFVLLLLTYPTLAQRWTAKQANDWYKTQPFFVGANYVPNNAINQIEMWQADPGAPAGFDPATAVHVASVESLAALG